MKKRNLIYLASTAVLMAASAQQVLADVHETTNSKVVVGTNLVNKQSATIETGHIAEKTSSAPVVEDSAQKLATKESQQVTSKAAEVATTVVQKNESVVETKDKKAEKTVSSAEKEAISSYSTVIEPSNVGAKGSFVDVSSHNSDISVADYKELARQGVSGVVVKLTEGTFYKNPYAQSQIRNAQEIGLKVSAYAFSHYTNENEARAEAQYFVQRVRELNLPAATVLVNDIEDSDMKRNINQNTQAWTDEMKRLGFSNLVYYTSAAWLDINNLRNRGPIQTSKFGLQNFWVAQYPENNLNVSKAQELNYNNGAAGWQFTSQAQLLIGKHVFDQSLDYTGRFTNRFLAKPTGTINIVDNNLQTGNFDIVITNVSSPAGVREVKVPVWSTGKPEVHTLVWYTAVRHADGSYKVHVDSSAHKNVTGKYYVDVYALGNNDQLTYLTGTTTVVSRHESSQPRAKLVVTHHNPQTGSFDVVISEAGAPNGVKELRVPVWSTGKPGVHTLVWYTAVQQTDGSYKVHVDSSAHKNVIGKYYVDVYALGNNDQLTYLTGTTTNVKRNEPIL